MQDVVHASDGGGESFHSQHSLVAATFDQSAQLFELSNGAAQAMYGEVRRAAAGNGGVNQLFRASTPSGAGQPALGAVEPQRRRQLYHAVS